jgi:hypothetical protein
MVDSLNAEISLGTIRNMQEAIEWLGYTYLFGELVDLFGTSGPLTDDTPTVRMKRNPFVYGGFWYCFEFCSALIVENMLQVCHTTNQSMTLNLGTSERHWYIPRQDC